jgi:ribosomal protein S18 acetylase RimI-like enzyme
MITIKAVTEHSELEGIKKLQEENLMKNLSDREAEKEGFVTAEYTMEFLEKMHDECPSVIAKDGDLVIGYVLAAVKAIRHQHELLEDLFDSIDKIHYRNKPLKDANYVVVGQLCVSKNYRGIGLVQQLYQNYKNYLSPAFDFCLTDVAKNNPRSLKAHLKSGFIVIAELQYNGSGWDIVLWNWKSGTAFGIPGS